MDIHVSVAIVFCVVTVHHPAQQGSSIIQEHEQDKKQSRYPIWLQGQCVVQNRLPMLVQMAVQILQQMAVQISQQMAVHIIQQMAVQIIQQMAVIIHLETADANASP